MVNENKIEELNTLAIFQITIFKPNSKVLDFITVPRSKRAFNVKIFLEQNS